MDQRNLTKLKNSSLSGKVFSNLKTGDAYQVLYDALDVTNNRDVVVIVYHKRDSENPDEVFVREKQEFIKKFQIMV